MKITKMRYLKLDRSVLKFNLRFFALINTFNI